MKREKIIEHGLDKPDDNELNLISKGSTQETTYDGKVINKESKTVHMVRDRIIDPSIPEGKDGHITYTDWKTVKK